MYSLKASDGLLHSWDGHTLVVPSSGPPGQPVARITVASQSFLVLSVSGASSTDSAGNTIKTYAWDLGDGSTASTPTVTHTYALPGTYTVKLTVTDNTGVSNSTQQVFALQQQSTNRPPVPALSVTVNGGSGLTVTVDATGSTDPDGYLNKIVMGYGDGGSDVSNLTDVGGLVYTRTHTYSSPGTYTVGLTVYDDAGKGTTVYQTITVTAAALPPKAIITSPTISGATFSASGSTSTDPQGQGLNYAWDYGDGGQSSGATASHVYAANGPWTVLLTVTNTSGLSSVASVSASPQIGGNTPYVNDDGLGTANGAEPSGFTSYASASGAGVGQKLSSAKTTVSMAPGTFTIAGFGSTPYDAAHQVTSQGIIGSGSAKTILTMAAQSSSGATFAALKGQTNAYEMLRFTLPSGLLEDFTLQATPQTIANTSTGGGANCFGGIMVNADNWTLRRVKIKGVPGDDKAPPGETFPLSYFKAYGTQIIEDVEIDGQNLSASNFGINGSGTAASAPQFYLQGKRVYSHNNPYSGAVAWWQTNFDPRSFLDDSVFDLSRCFWNIERCAGTVTLNRPRIGTLKAATTGWANGKTATATGIFCESDATWGAAASQAFRFIIRDPRNLNGTVYSGPPIGVQYGSANDGGTQYYGRNNFKCYDAVGNDISSTFFSSTGTPAN